MYSIYKLLQIKGSQQKHSSHCASDHGDLMFGWFRQIGVIFFAASHAAESLALVVPLGSELS
jgi:hypothetical protein